MNEFNSIYVLDLRGNQRTQGEESRREGGKVFGSGSRAPIAITMLVKCPDSEEHGVVRYVDVGDYKTQREKLDFAAGAAVSEPEWSVLSPDSHGDWLNQRDESFYEFMPMGIAKYKAPYGMFETWSAGLKTQRDPWCWNYSLPKVTENTQTLIENTNAQIVAASGDERNIERDATKYSWTSSFISRVREKKALNPNLASYVLGMYRPFCRQWLCYDPELNERTYQQMRLFPLVGKQTTAENIVIDTGERGSFISRLLPDLELNHHGQCFPLYWYEMIEDHALFNLDGSKTIRDSWGNNYMRHDGIADQTLELFHAAYPMAYTTRAKSKGGSGIAKEDVFYYIYGILHSPLYREKYAANLAKELPRIPLVRDFEQFADAGRQLAYLHLHYEELEPWPTVSVEMLHGVVPGPVQKIKWAKKKDPETGKRVDDHTKLIYNANVTITGIPEEAQGYVVNGRSPLDWVIDRYQVKPDKKSGITNDPNDYSEDPWYIIDLIVRLVRVSMETQQIVQTLPTNIDEIPHPDNWPVEWTVRQ